jgi:hypothetical protein
MTAELNTHRLTPCPKRPSKPWISLVGCPFRAENRGRPLCADADDCLTAEIGSKPGAGSCFAGRAGAAAVPGR